MAVDVVVSGASDLWEVARMAIPALLVEHLDRAAIDAGPRFRLPHAIGVGVATALRVHEQDVGGEAASRLEDSVSCVAVPRPDSRIARSVIHEFSEVRPRARISSMLRSNPRPVDVQRPRPKALRQIRVGHALARRDGEDDGLVCGLERCSVAEPCLRGIGRWCCNIHDGVARFVGAHRGVWKLVVFPPTDTASDFRSDYFTLSPSGLVDGL